MSNCAPGASLAKRKTCLFCAEGCSGLHRSHSFFSCGPSDRTAKEQRGMFDGLLDSRRPESTSPGDPTTLSLICHPMQVIVSVCSCVPTLQAQPWQLCFTGGASACSRSCRSAGATPGSPRGRCLCVGMERGWTWCLANTGSLSAPTAKVRGRGPNKKKISFHSFFTVKKPASLSHPR